MSCKTTINWLLNDIWCLFIVCFDWKIGIFQQTVVRVYYILKAKIRKDKERWWGDPSIFLIFFVWSKSSGNIWNKSTSRKITEQLSLRENWPNTELFLVCIFLYSDWIRRDTISPYSVRIQENTDQKELCIWTLFR